MVSIWDLVGPDKFVVNSNISSTAKSLRKELEAFTNTNFLYHPARRLVEKFQHRKKPPNKFIQSKSNIYWMSNIIIGVIYSTRIYLAIIYIIVGFVHLDASFSSPKQSRSMASLSLRKTSCRSLMIPARTWVRTEVTTLIFYILRFKFFLHSNLFLRFNHRDFLHKSSITLLLTPPAACALRAGAAQHR